MMLTRPPSAADRQRDAKRERKRRCRRRQAHGLVVLKVEVSEDHLAEALLASNRLTADQALIKGELEKAVADLVGDFIARWGTRPFA